MPDRQVRFTEQFFDRLEELLPDERGDDGTPSITDFLLLELPAVRDDLVDEIVEDFLRCTLPTDDPDVRVYTGTGVLVGAYAIYASLVDEIVEAFWMSLDRSCVLRTRASAETVAHPATSGTRRRDYRRRSRARGC